MDTPANNEPSAYEKIVRDLWNEVYPKKDRFDDQRAPILVSIGDEYVIAWTCLVPDEDEDGCWKVDRRMATDHAGSYHRTPEWAWRCAVEDIRGHLYEKAEAHRAEAARLMREAKESAVEVRNLDVLGRRTDALVRAAERKIARDRAANRKREKGVVA